MGLASAELTIASARSEDGNCNDRTRVSRNAHALVEHHPGAGDDRDAVRPAGGDGAFLALQGDRDRAVRLRRWRNSTTSEILRAAELLAHAKVNVIAWNGTSSGWLGFERDVRLCERITQATGIPACTAMLALNELLELTGAKRVGFVTPYLDDVQARINANYAKAG